MQTSTTTTFVEHPNAFPAPTRNATIVADTDIDLVVRGKSEFEGLLDEVPGFARKMLAGTAHRLREADARVIEEGSDK